MTVPLEKAELRRRALPAVAALTAAILLFHALCPARAADLQIAEAAAPLAVQQIDSLTRRIVTKEIELLRLNTYYRLESTKTGKWRHWRQFLWNMGGFVCSNVGISHVAYARWKTWQRPQTARKEFLYTGPTLLLIGHSMFLGGALIEKGFDIAADLKAKRKGFDYKTFRRKSMDVRSEID